MDRNMKSFTHQLLYLYKDRNITRRGLEGTSVYLDSFWQQKALTITMYQQLFNNMIMYIFVKSHLRKKGDHTMIFDL